MKQLKLLTVSFNTRLTPREVSSFRGAMAAKVGLQHDLFHNHNNSEGKGKFYYRYPLIQYKSYQNHPLLLCIGEGVEEAHKFFAKSNWDIKINGKIRRLEIKDLNLKRLTLNVNGNFYAYRLVNWLALNQENYKKYKSFTFLADKISFLEKLLESNIITFAKGIDWKINDPVKVHIQNIEAIDTVRAKGIPMLSFTIDFQTNAILPNYIGLGKSVSRGFGMVTNQRK